MAVAGTVAITATVGTPAAGAAPPPPTPCAPDAGYNTCSSYALAPAGDQPFAVPDGITAIRVKVWGAGGGGSSASPIIGAPGGSGGYVQGDLTVVPGDQYVIVAGEGRGADGMDSGSTACQPAYGFGGARAPPRTPGTAYVDGGGGLSGLFTGSAKVEATGNDRAVLVAGGGGSGEGTNSCTSGGNISAAGGADGSASSGGMPTMQGIAGVFNSTRRGTDNTAPVNAAGTEATTLPKLTVNPPPHTADLQYTVGVGRPGAHRHRRLVADRRYTRHGQHQPMGRGRSAGGLGGRARRAWPVAVAAKRVRADRRISERCHRTTVLPGPRPANAGALRFVRTVLSSAWCS